MASVFSKQQMRIDQWFVFSYDYKSKFLPLSIEQLEDRILLSACEPLGAVVDGLVDCRNWITYAPTHYNPDIGDDPNKQEIRADLNLLFDEGWRGLVTYSLDGTLREIPRIAKEVGFTKVIAGVFWYDNDQLEREKIAAVQELEFVDAFVVGNEGILTGRYTFQQLQSQIDWFQGNTGKPVTTTETSGQYFSDPRLLDLGDWVFPNIQPWHNPNTDPTNMDSMVQTVKGEYQELQRLSDQRQVIFKEVWWTTEGTGAATEANQSLFFDQLAAEPVKFVWGEAFDQPWKSEGSGHGVPLGPTWGLHNSDGSAKQVISDLAAIYNSDYPVSTFYFTAVNGGGQTELHSSNGLFGGTKQVKNLAGAASSNPQELTMLGDSLFFTALIQGQRELYMSDGTAADTKLVKNLAGIVSSDPKELTVFADKLFFTSIMANGQRELFTSDGTAAGTVLVSDLAGAISSNPLHLTVAGSSLFFTAKLSNGQRELHVSNGTLAGTQLLKNLSGSGSSNPHQLTPVGNKLFFTANMSNGQEELHLSDGTTTGTTLLKNLAGSTSSTPTQLTAVGNRLYFTAKLNSEETELHTSNGTGIGTKLVKNLAGDSSPQELTALGASLFFTARLADGQRELFRSNGTAAGTFLVIDLPVNSSPGQLTALGKTLFFTSKQPSGARELFKSDGTALGTELVKDLPGNSNPLQLTVVDHKLFFTALVNGQRELYKSNGFAPGTQLVRNLSGSISADPDMITS